MFHRTSTIDKNNSTVNRVFNDSKAELFSILQTANFLKSRFDIGLIDMDFYFKRMRFFHNELMILQQKLLPQKKSLIDIVNRFPVNKDLKPILTIISSIQDYNFNKFAQKWQMDPVQLAAEATKITSNFITLIDYLHLVDDFDEEMLMEFIRELRISLGEMKTFEPFFIHIFNLENELPRYFRDIGLSNNSNQIQIKSVITEIEDIVYDIYKDFKRYLGIS